MYYVYILQSLVDGSFYVGYTPDVEKRLHEHNAGVSFYTRRKKPWKVCHTEEYQTRSEAMKRERQIKGYKGNKVMLSYLIKGFS